jgi:elongation factor Ts
MVISTEMVKELRERTGAGVMDSKNALVECEGNIDKACELLRKRGIAKAEKKVGRTANQGLVDAYIHGGGRIGVLVEVNCETDFVARTDDFKNLVHEIALQIAAARPEYVTRDDVPAEVVEREKGIYLAQVGDKPANVAEKILEGKLEKFYQEVCLVEQPFIRDPNVNVKQLITDTIAKTGENIVVRRFTRYELGGA